MTNIYHATPYDFSATGFYFQSYEDYREKASTHRNTYGHPVEEYEIQFIDGDNHTLFNAIGVNQANLKLWFDVFEKLDGSDVVKAIYLADYLGGNVDEILDHLDDVVLFEGTPKEYAESLIEETGLLSELPENLRFYFDVEAFARDLIYAGDITEIEIFGTTWIVLSR